MRTPTARTPWFGSARGLTFAELLVAVAIIAIVGAIATPTLTGFVERQRLRSATEHVLAAVSTARTEAQR
ncbi:prepilin-type N-terminal cleavage/methylation domain-containing protein [Tepidimonas sp.]|uniref:prepilin-type N-terminal cleavage/methylation domain-containing protein n=1 Tax=Tepidimonas sp. TaxID=2002775 RepID=UPI0028CEE698|nr:prepilin-type N-terminal cleavage/methylation domain-containing protein [Tepidimonas sp.]MDT7929687.1 prepilin-type N-terminal cleavage/methylation domain-containing protein [Tepidimonas sp.]